MKKMIGKNIIISSITVLASVLIVFSVVKAGSLTSPGAPAVTMYTLEDIYNKLIGSSSSPHTDLNPDAGPSSTMVQISSIYASIPTIIANKILYNTTYFGVAGTANTPPGSGTEATNSDLASGLYAFKSDGTTITGATFTWQTDPVLQLCHDAGAFATSNGCSAGVGLLDPTTTGTPLLGADEYCKYLNADGTTIATTEQNIWRLPTQAELVVGLSRCFMAGATGCSEFPVEAAPDIPPRSYFYWTSSLEESDTYYWAQSYFSSLNYHWDNSSSTHNVRCVYP
jgi:hypothetical protein